MRRSMGAYTSNLFNPIDTGPVSGDGRYDFMVSFSRNERDFKKTYCDRLRATGAKVLSTIPREYWSFADYTSGRFENNSGIKYCDAYVTLFTMSSTDSRHLIYEARIAAKIFGEKALMYAPHDNQRILGRGESFTVPTGLDAFEHVERRHKG